MNAVTFSRLAAIIFLTVASAHLYRAITHASIQLGSLPVPLWVSWLVVPAAGMLGFLGIRARAA